MKDRWRADDHFSARRKEGDPDKEAKPTSSSRRKNHSTQGLRIRGRAADEAAEIEATQGRSPEYQGPQAIREKRREPSPPHRGWRGEKSSGSGSAKQEHGRRAERTHREHRDRPRRRRSSERFSARDVFDYRDAEPRGLGSPNRTKARRRSRGRDGPREQYQSHTGHPGDSYTPSHRRASPSPHPPNFRYQHDENPRGRPRSREILDRPPKSSLTPPSPRQRSPPRRRTPPPDSSRNSGHRPRHRSRDSQRFRDLSQSAEFKNNRRQIRLSRSPRHKRARRDGSPESRMQYPHAPQSMQNYPPSGHFSVGNPPHQPQHGNPLHRQVRPPRLDTRHQHSGSPQWTPSSSHHGSPHSTSPYPQVHGGWVGQQSFHPQPGVNSYTPPQRQNSYPPQSNPSPQYYSGQQSPYQYNHPNQQGYPAQPMRGGHGHHRGHNFAPTPDRRLSGPGPSPPFGSQAPRGKFGFQNLQWTAGSDKRGREGGQSSPDHGNFSSYQANNTAEEEDDNPFRPSKDLQVEDQSEKAIKARQARDASPKEGSKISFAFKTKPPSAPSAKPPPDLSQRMKDPSRNKDMPTADIRSRREHHGPGERYPRDYRYNVDSRYDRDQRRDRGRERSPRPTTEKKIIKEKRPERTLSPSLADSTSVYYRKPGNESVVGSGTYGKVFKAIHVYTKDLAALKKIRMDGEKDGFPVTAVREIKLLQSLKHDNVVSLQEVMVEHNDCFMVFEYLSHDLTGLLNHPTFKLEHSHKKHLGRQLFEGLNYLHKRGVLHRDIKAANILVSNEGQLKLADFGLARFYSKRGKPDYTNRVITIWYRSPELLLGETQYGPAVDIWSAACVMIEIFTRHAIFPGDGGEISQLDKIYNVLGTPTRSEWPGLVEMAWFELLRPTERKSNSFAEKYQGRMTPAAFELLTSIFVYDPAKRPSAADVLAHSYFIEEEPAPQQAIEYVFELFPFSTLQNTQLT